MLTWSLIQTSTLTDDEKETLKAITNFSNTLNNFTSLSGVQEIIQSGIFSMIAPGIQITSCMMLVNGILPRHLYEGIRIFAVFILYQVPSWEKDTENSRYILSQQIQSIIPEANSLTKPITTHRRLLK